MNKKQRAEKARATREAQQARRGRSLFTPHEETDDERSFRHKQALTTAKWNRYMLIRYLDAGLFFIGLYWAFMLFMTSTNLWALAVPLVDFVVGGVVLWEVNRVLTHDIEYLKISHYSLLASIAVSFAALIATALVGKDLFFPVLASSALGMGSIAVVIALKAIIVWRIVLVRDHRDKKRYNLYLQQLHFSSDSKGR